MLINNINVGPPWDHGRAIETSAERDGQGDTTLRTSGGTSHPGADQTGVR